jgi:hypothetical protein
VSKVPGALQVLDMGFDPGQLPTLFSTVQNVPLELQPYITPFFYNVLMGFAGIVSAFLVHLIWSRGL